LKLKISLLIIVAIISLFGTVWANEQGLTRKGIITSNKVNLRITPDLAGTIITTLSKNTEVTILSQDTSWYKVCLADKREGWVAKDYVVSNSQFTNRGIGSINLISFAKKLLNIHYRYGGSSPAGFDCSGFTRYVFIKFGFLIPHNAAAQGKIGDPVSKDGLLPGDLVFFTGKHSTEIIHVGIYIGNDQFIHASSGSGAVCISSLNEKYYETHYNSARRFAEDTGRI
jgi:cell wall-associated NlpC family hydrolase